MATEIVGISKSLSLTFYILLSLVILLVTLVIFLIKKLKYDAKQIWKSIGISLLISIGIQLLLMIISFFLPQPMCKIGGHCPSQAEILLLLSPYIIPGVFLIAILFYYIIILLISLEVDN